MALISGTGTRYDFKGLREDLSDIIYDISPEDTPFISGASREKARQTLVEWQIDSLAAAVTTNAQLEGNDATFTTPAATTRVGNHTQISDKTLILSGTLEEIDKAGRRSELAYQIAKRGREIKRDLEAMALENIAADAGAVGTARKSAGLGAWVKTNDDFGAGGASPVYTSLPNATRTDGTQRAFTEVILQNVMELAWNSGGDPSVLLVGSHVKGVVSGFSGQVTRNFDMSNVSPAPTAVIAAIDVYVDDFGVLKVIPNRFQRARDAWFIDFEFVAISNLRPFRTMRLAKTGDAEKRLLLTEWTLKIKNEAALGLAADLNTS